MNDKGKKKKKTDKSYKEQNGWYSIPTMSVVSYPTEPRSDIIQTGDFKPPLLCRSIPRCQPRRSSAKRILRTRCRRSSECYFL